MVELVLFIVYGNNFITIEYLLIGKAENTRGAGRLLNGDLVAKTLA